ncbi:MAG: hypothetical protein NTW74_12370, partial [Acidobacteria bacterium]|nr:hypothetical protein [Acidobacteriota bacterium]
MKPLPLDGKGRLSIRPSKGDTSIPRVPALRLLQPTTDTPNLQGKLVVLGVHAAGIQEQDSALLQATAIDNLLNATAFAGPGTSPLAEWFLMIGALAAAFWPLT